MENKNSTDILVMTIDIACAYIGNNAVPPSELPNLIIQVHRALTNLSAPTVFASGRKIEKPTPAQIRKSITPDALISFVDGKPYRILKRHLGVHGLSLDDYRTRYGLPSDYPSVSANYSAFRSALARELILGHRREHSESAPVPAHHPAPSAKPKRPSRSRRVPEPA